MLKVNLYSIFYKQQSWMGIFFPPDPTINSHLLKLGSNYSKTYGCYLLPREKGTFTILKAVFPAGTIFNDSHLREQLLKEKTIGNQPPTQVLRQQPAPTTAK